MSNFGAKLEHLLASRAEFINRMNKLPPAEGNDLDKLTGQPKITNVVDNVPNIDCIAWPDEKSAAVSVILPPLESFMDVPEQIRRDRFFQTAQRGDVLIGYVSAMQDSGLVVTILSYDYGPRRDFDGLKLTGFCPVRQIPRMNAGNALDNFQINDRVRVYVLDIHQSGRLILSMNPKGSDRDLYGDVRYGVIAEEEQPLHFKKLQNLDNKTFEEFLETTPQFQNPDGVNVLCKRFGIPRSSICSLLQPYARLSLPKSEMGIELRRQQLRSLSMKRVAQGVKFFKEGRHTEALQCYTFAIDIEDTNPDAYVAKGALYASSGNYSKAIDDFEQALNLKASHVNAKNYLGQTLVAYANEIQSKDSIKAQKTLKRAIQLDRSNKDARTLMRHISGTDQLSDEENVESDEAPYKRHAREWSRSLSRSPRHDRSEAPSRKRQSHLTPSPHGRQQDFKRFRSPNASPEHFQRRETNEGQGDYAKIVITRDRGGRTIRQENSFEINQSREQDEEIKETQNSLLRHQRRIYSPPKNARITRDGAMTKYENENDLPTSSKVLQERLQAKLAAIERRHGGTRDDEKEGSRSPEPAPPQHPPRQNIWVPPPSQHGDRPFRGRGGPYRRTRDWHDGPRGRFFPRGGRGGGRRYSRSPQRRRSRSDSCEKRRLDDSTDSRPRSRSPSGGHGGYRRRPYGHRGGRGRFERRGGHWQKDRRHYAQERKRSSRSSSRGSESSWDDSGSPRKQRRRSKKSFSRSPSSPPPMRQGGKKANVTRAVLNLPDLAPLEKSNRLTDSQNNESLADVDNFVAQLKAKRQNVGGAEIGPRIIPSSGADAGDSPMRSPHIADHIRLE